MTNAGKQLDLFQRKPTLFDRYSLLVLMGFAFALPSLLLLARTAVQSHQNKVQDWLPKNYTETRDLVEFRQHFRGDQFVVVSWDGCRIGGNPASPDCEADDPRIENLVRLLMPDAVFPEFGDVEGDALPRSDAGPDAGAVAPPTPPPIVVRDISQSATGTDLPQESELEKLREYVASVTTARGTLWQMMGGPRGLTYRTASQRLAGSLLGPDGKTSCVVIQLSDAAIGNFRELLARPTSGWLRVLHPEGLLFRALRQAGIEPESAVLGGPPVDNVAIDQEGQRTLLRLAGLAGLLGLTLAWISLRSLVLTGMVFLCGIVSAAGSLALVAAMGDHTDAILFSMPPLVYVLAMSGAVHLINYYRETARSEGLDLAVERAMAMGWKPAVLCTATTALGLLSLCTSELTPIRKFGLYSAAGVVLMLGSLFLLLPAMLKLWPRSLVGPVAEPRRGVVAGNIARPGLIERFWGALGSGIVRRHGWVSLGCVIVIGLSCWGLTKVRSSVDLMKLFGPEARILHDYRWLEANLGNLVPLEVVLRFDHRCMADQDAEQRAIAEGRPVRETLSSVERLELVRNVQRLVNNRFGRTGSGIVSPPVSLATFLPQIPPAEKNASAVARRSVMELALENRPVALANTGYFHRDEATGDELWRISVRVAAFRDVDYGDFTGELRSLVDPAIASATAGLSGGSPAVTTTYTGVIPIVYKAQRALLASLVSSTWWSFATITPLLMLVARGFLAGLVSMLPNLLPVVCIFGAMGWLGVNIDIGSMMAASIALGVAVDDTIHYLTWFRHELDATGDRKQAIVGAYRHCATPTLQAALISGLGLSVFAFSSFMPTKKFGYLMLTILVAGMVAELVLLPALLASPLGRVFRINRVAGESGAAAKTSSGQQSAQRVA